MTPNTTRQNITYKFKDAIDLWDRHDTIIWNTSIKIQCRECFRACSTGGSWEGCYKLIDYVNAKGGLRDDIINKYDGYWNVLNIIDVECDTSVNYFHFSDHWMIIIASVFLVSSG